MWAVILASFTLSAQTWIEIARLAGFTQITHPLGGKDSVEITRHAVHLAWCMPVVVDGYVMVALLLWMSDVDERLASFARKNTYAAAAFGVVAQSAFHAFTISGTPRHDVWQVVLAAAVGAIPPGFAAMAVHMRVLVTRFSGTTDTEVGMRVPVIGSAGTEEGSTPDGPLSTPVLISSANALLPAKSTSVPEVRPGMSDAEIISDMYSVGELTIRQIKSRYGIGQPRAERVRGEYARGVPVLGEYAIASRAASGRDTIVVGR
jgi:hypothetical protein